MRQLVVLMALATTLVGCALQPNAGGYGSFIGTTPVDQQRIADDAVQQLVAAYPPARTQIDLQHPAGDPFGVALVKSLRARGYSVLEYSAAPAAAASAAGVVSTTGLPLRYVLGRVDDVGLIHIRVAIGNQSFARPYAVQPDGSTAPVGRWARKE